MDPDGRLLASVVRARSAHRDRLARRPGWLLAVLIALLLTGGALATRLVDLRVLMDEPLGRQAPAVVGPAAATPEQMAVLLATPGAGSSAAAPTAAPLANGPRRYIVQPGDTLQSIAERLNLRTETLTSVNDLVDPDLLKPGRELLVPPIDGLAHIVQPGDTLQSIAERYGVDVRAIVSVNDLSDPDHIAVGLRLFVPGARPLPAPSAPPSGELQEQVRSAPGPVAAASDGAESESPEPAMAAILTVGPHRVDAAPPPAVSARYVAVVDEDSGQLLWGSGEHTRAAPASITKIVTTIVALERGGDLEQIVPVTVSGSAMAARDGSSIMGVEPGQRVHLRTLLYGMMLPSGNDAAEQIALSLAGSREQFVAWMNEEVDSLELQDTHFVTPSGMDAPGQYSSAYDMARLARYAMQNPTFRMLAAAATYRADGFSLRNLNRLIGHYDGADGVKIGSTPAAGRTIVASAARGGHRVFASLLHSRDLSGDSEALLDWVWRTFAW
jgi:LysM repeat protein